MFMMTIRQEWYTILWLHLIVLVSTDFQCICNYSKYGVPVYQNTTRTSVLIGVLDINDCKQYLYPASEQSTAFYAIMYRHQIGFVMEIHTKEINCQGTPSVKDTVTVSSLTPTELTARFTHPSRQATVAQTTIVAFNTPTSATASVTSPTTTRETTIPTTPAVTTRETTTTTKPTTTYTTTLALTTAITANTVPSTASATTTKRPVTTTTTTTAAAKTTTMTTSKTTTQAPTTSSTTPQTTSTTTSKPSTTQTTSTLPTTTTTKTTTTTRRITTPKPSTIPGPSTLEGHIEMCPNRLQSLADQSREYIAQYEENCYEVVQTRVAWSHAESNCKHYGGHLIHIANQQEQDFIYSFLKKHHSSTVWIGLHDRNQEERFEWTSGYPVTYTNWIPGRKDYRYHNSEDCVFMTTVKGQWDDIQCGGDNALSELFQGIRHPYICQYATVLPPTTVDPSNLDGNTEICPYSLRQQAIRDKGVLGQYNHSCYEIVQNTKVAWQHAEETCHSRGGHLAYISNIQEQAFVKRLLNIYSPNNAVWIGLTDQNSEGRFHWTSGTPVQFTNWVPGHVSNYVDSSQENCVAFIPYKNGQWDDIPCGSTHHSIFDGTSSSGETHPLLCQYPISAGPSLIG